jgi:hypothetical protein
MDGWNDGTDQEVDGGWWMVGRLDWTGLDGGGWMVDGGWMIMMAHDA